MGREVDVTDRVTWTIADTSIAYASGPTLISKALGKTRISCHLDNFEATATVTIESIPKQDSVIFFQGLRRLQQLRFSTDGNLFICNQSAQVYRIDPSGRFETVLRLPVADTAVYAITRLAVDAQNRLYVNDLTRNACHRFEWDGKKYARGTLLATKSIGSKQSIATNSLGQAFITIFGRSIDTGTVARIDPDGTEVEFSLRSLATSIAIDSQDNIYVDNRRAKCIDVFRGDGTFIEPISHGSADSVSDITIDNQGTLFLALFHSGRVLVLPKGSRTPTLLPGTFGTLGGIALDSLDRIYVSDFGGDRISLIY
ncbi:hypothetical protein [Bradyrhizobium sp. LTSP849]|jgi:hypothetical protein|uniref:hypothetical protein n=1 Tax=Bradyrhizobium sp. LTSP849 TaxID=1615890 RepID=UPI000ADC2CA6|nr:hypothetical protein [Bradyrhizobium sp. LTSP849]